LIPAIRHRSCPGSGLSGARDLPRCAKGRTDLGVSRPRWAFLVSGVPPSHLSADEDDSRPVWARRGSGCSTVVLHGEAGQAGDSGHGAA